MVVKTTTALFQILATYGWVIPTAYRRKINLTTLGLCLNFGLCANFSHIILIVYLFIFTQNDVLSSIHICTQNIEISNSMHFHHRRQKKNKNFSTLQVSMQRRTYMKRFHFKILIIQKNREKANKNSVPANHIFLINSTLTFINGWKEHFNLKRKISSLYKYLFLLHLLL